MFRQSLPCAKRNRSRTGSGDSPLWYHAPTRELPSSEHVAAPSDRSGDGRRPGVPAGKWGDEMCHLLWKRTRLAVLLAALAAPVPLTGAVAASGTARSPYQAIDLSPTELGIAVANAISGAGLMAGYADSEGLVKYHSWTPAIFVRGGFTTLGVVPGYIFGDITGINDAGQAVGWSTTAVGPVPGVTHATLFENGHATDLGVLPGGTASEAMAINAAGDAVGFSTTAEGQQTRAVLFSHGAVIDLGSLPGATYTVATALNNRGQAVGYAYFASATAMHAVLFAGGTVTDLGLLPGGSNSAAYGINDLGQIVGMADLSLNVDRAALFENGTVRNLGTVPGGTYSVASGINNWGQIVGTSDGGTLGFNPAVFENGTASFLPLLPGDLFGNALAINDAGDIVGGCSFFPESAPQHAVLWTLAHQFVLPGRVGR